LHKIGAGSPGDRLLLLGNEAIARGVVEAGAKVVSSYPGTPSSEIVETLLEVSSELGFYAEWSINEKVAFELAAGAALVGARSMVAMKGAGLNVVMDLFLTLPYGGVRGGFVVVVADDPGAHYSSNEQDSRWAAQWAMIPCLEPESHQEAKEMTKAAFGLSERLELPVMVRTATRLSHSSGVVELGEVVAAESRVGFNKHWRLPFRWNVYGPPGAPDKHEWLLDRQPKCAQESERLSFNDLRPGSDGIGVITCGTAAAYVREALRHLDVEDRVWLLKVGMPYPLPSGLACRALRECEQVVVIEEGDPIVESQLRALAQAEGLHVRILGRQFGGAAPSHDELSTASVVEVLAGLLDVSVTVDTTRTQAKRDLSDLVTPRSSTLCAGCSHLGTYWALRIALGEQSSRTHIINGDIGCYEQAGYGVKGRIPLPSDQSQQHVDSEVLYDLLDTLYVMGSGVAMAQGQTRAGYGEGTVVAVAGDSTFFHSCMPALLNAVWNETKLTFVVMDNYWTAMTGHQPSPTTGERAAARPSGAVPIEDVARSLGVERVEVVDPYDLQATTEAIRRAAAFDGVSVVVARGECMLQILRRERRFGVPYVVTEDCIACGDCVRLGCPAIVFSDDGARIDELLCVGCDICAQLCPTDAIVASGDA
jgi:indolepyruvate ferredoxin oxidoreductase alpha subunit